MQGFIISMVFVIVHLLGCGQQTLAAPPKQVVVNWVPGAIDPTHGPATSFVVEKAANPAGPFSVVATVVAPPYIDKITNIKKPCYRVAGQNTSGASMFSSVACVQ
jgi:hypothetical protein